MPKKLANALTPLGVKNAKPGRHADGGGLHLLVKESGARSWVFRFMLRGKSRDLGLSRCPEAIVLLRKTGAAEISLGQARDIAASFRLKVKAGIDPLEEREEEVATKAAAALTARVQGLTFKAAAEIYIKTNEGNWRNEKHRQQWRNTLDTYAHPAIGDIPVAEITSAHVLSIIEPIWKLKPETASRVRGRIEGILDAAKARGYREGENPARWRGHMAQILPKRSKLTRGHHKAMPYEGVPDFLAKLRARQAVAGLALEFTILTAARSGEVLGATWEEVDIEKAVWTIPAERMKAAKEHRVPLSAPAAAILEKVKPIGSERLFPGARVAQLSGMAMGMMLRRMQIEATVHGFRSAFRDWSAEQTSFAHEVCEMALAHTINNKAEAAYRRGDLLDKRRALMDAWATYCAGKADNGPQSR